MAPRYAWVAKAYSPHDGGWVRIFGNFKTEELAWEAVHLFWETLVTHGDHKTIEVIKTIKFDGERKYKR